ncbi:MAG: hypothetical protein O3A46_13485, partial [Candidatus Poribacteria bacterium]|nr:hypothetical protein [Candidatus Poribacteria bacterium]
MGRIVGVDFSGGKDAGRKVWIAEGVPDNDGLRIERCAPIAERVENAVGRDAAMIALVDFLANAPDAVVGLDFPFSLPDALIPYHSWESFLDHFPTDYPTDDAFRAHCRQFSRGVEWKRLTDTETKTPFCAYNLR